MVDTWSGAIVYEWIQETNYYGIVSYGPGTMTTAAGGGVEEGFGRTGTPMPVSPDFDTLSKHWATLSPSGVRKDDYKPSLSAPPCPAFTTGAWEVEADAPLPSLAHGSGGTSSTSSKTAHPTASASATGKAAAGEQGSDEGDSDKAQDEPAATSSSVAQNVPAVPPGFGLRAGLWLGAYVALCGIAGFAIL